MKTLVMIFDNQLPHTINKFSEKSDHEAKSQKDSIMDYVVYKSHLFIY